MTSISAITLNTLTADQKRIERVASNLANVQTPGYKRELWVEGVGMPGSFVRVMSDLQPEAAGSFATSTNTPSAWVNGPARDPSVGTLRPTGRPLDLAFTGAGYFEVATTHGPAYTRRGDFQVDARGRLVTQQGHAVLGIGGEITLSTDKPTVDAFGRILDGNHQVAQLRLIELEANQLQMLGAGLYSANGPVRELTAAQVAIRQGYLENANVDVAHEMVSLTANVRHFEAMLRVAQGRDEMLGTAIRKLGDA